MTYHEIVLQEPLVGEILEKLTPDTCIENRYFQYEKAKTALTQFVGVSARSPELRTSAAYMTVIGDVVRRLEL